MDDVIGNVGWEHEPTSSKLEVGGVANIAPAILR